MKNIPWRIVVGVFLLSFAVGSPAAARPAPTICSDVLTTTVIPSDLVVPERSHCELNGVTVRGDVRLRQGAGFTPYDSQIEGSITGAQFELLQLLNTHVAGGIRLHGGVTVEIGTATVAGDIRLSDTRDARVVQSEVLGSLVIRGAGDQVQFCGTTVRGDARFAGNSGWVMVGGDLASCAANDVRGDLRVQHNQQQITVTNNAVGQNLVCTANEPAPTVYANQVGGRARGQCGAGEAVDAGELGDVE
jgi:hypothetical protein